MHEFLQISQILDPALCWTPRYLHNPVGPRGGPYRNQCSPQKFVQSAKNQCNLETITIGPMSRLPVLAGNVARVWRRNPSRPAASPSSRKGAATRPTWLQGYRTRPLEPKSRLQHGVGVPPASTSTWYTGRCPGPWDDSKCRHLPLPTSWAALLFGNVAGDFAAAYVNQAISIHSEYVSRYKI